ncbi:hypothetical protein E1B28_002961 [Marasmius oreades]|uniref:F-box domain-containing protein n=1 Tax=Marasmius oreades TaxID=181124 RepID=A0A9P7UK33_9AGAR|nr:uncharacterized protein E1B28_002961 [Marasmius oreades]KAG7085400.1 hypothetical protein E1B28_002961 [Marasmius oreades]
MAPRISSRLHAKRDNSNRPVTQDESENSDLEETQAKSVRKAKRAKTMATTTQVSANANPEVFRRTRGKRGLLEKLAKEAPLDILLEVFKHLEPRDILRLARTSKDLRDFLMARSSSSIWREARENIPNLPPLPNDLNEPQYASLLFDNHCHACLRSPCDNVNWECRVRCHKNCMGHLFLNYSDIENRPAGLKDSDLWEVVMHIPYHIGPRTHGVAWFTPMFERLLFKYMEIQGDEPAVKKWNKEKEQDFKFITSHARQCRLWDRDRRMERDAEQQTLRIERRQEIIKRLSASGWRPEELNHEEFVSHPLLKSSKPVTERAWNNLEPQLIDFLQALKDRRLNEERHRSLKIRYQLFDSAYEDKKDRDRLTVYPPISDLIVDADLGVIDDMIWNTPQEQQLTKSDFIDALREAEGDIAKFSQKWVEQKRQALVQVLRRCGLEEIGLRSAIFSCLRCGEKTWAPRIYMHLCATGSYARNDRPLGWKRSEFNPLYELNRSLWQISEFYANISMSRRLQEIMALCGKPEIDSIEDLEREDPLFECLETDGHTNRRLARWMEALVRLSEGDKVVLAVGEDTTSQISKQEQAQTLHTGVVCKHCPVDTELHYNIREHLHTKHGIDPTDVKRNIDWCYCLRTPAFCYRPRAVVLAS